VDIHAPLLAGLVDYAGLFPPASLPLDEALADYDKHLRGADAAMLGRFVLPVAALDKLVPWLETTWNAERPLRLSLLCSLDDLPAVGSFVGARSAVTVEALEMRLPADHMAGDWLDEVTGLLARGDLAGLELYTELPADRDAELILALGQRQAQHPMRRLGAKLRCGGVTRDLVPTVERIAGVLVMARDAGVPLKFTAGLHHPVRGMDHTEDVPMHGFLNVYGAALLAHAEDLSSEALAPILADTDPQSFGCNDGGFSWRDHGVTAEQLAILRANFLGGYGSCSFDDPVTDLRSLALLK